MSNLTNGRGLSSDEFGEDEIEWDDDETYDDPEGLSPIEEMVGDSMDVVAPDDDVTDDDDED